MNGIIISRGGPFPETLAFAAPLAADRLAQAMNGVRCTLRLSYRKCGFQTVQGGILLMWAAVDSPPESDKGPESRSQISQ